MKGLSRGVGGGLFDAISGFLGGGLFRTLALIGAIGALAWAIWSAASDLRSTITAIQAASWQAGHDASEALWQQRSASAAADKASASVDRESRLLSAIDALEATRVEIGRQRVRPPKETIRYVQSPAAVPLAFDADGVRELERGRAFANGAITPDVAVGAAQGAALPDAAAATDDGG